MLHYSPGKRPFESGPQEYTSKGAVLLSALKSRRIGGLDFVRAAAVSMVMLGHAADARPDLGWALEPLASLGVKAFFVLSGLLITRLLQAEIDAHGRIDYLAFYRRRVARLMPAFYLYLAVVLALSCVRDRAVPWDAVVSAMLYVVNYYQAFTGAQTNIVSHCWSLAVEEQFYVFWPLLFAALHTRRMRMGRALVLIILGVWCWRVFLVLEMNAAIHYLYRALDTRADDLAVGCLIAVLARSGEWRARLAGAMNFPGVGPVLVLLIYGSSLMDGQSLVFKYCFGYMVEPLMIGLLILITVGASTRDGLISDLLNSRLLVHIGKISYSMYLFHGLVMYSAQRLVEELTGSFWLGFALSFVAVILVATLSFRYVETPLAKLINGK